MYGETRNMTWVNDNGFANKTQNVEAVVQYQFDFGLRPSWVMFTPKARTWVRVTANAA
jgi:predicted porin